MRPLEIWQRCDRLQRTMLFRVIASILIVVAAIAVASGYALHTSTLRDQMAAEMATIESDAAKRIHDAQESGDPAAQLPTDRSSLDQGRQAVASLIAFRTDPTSVTIGAAMGAGIALLIVWLGLGLTYLFLLLATAMICGPLWWIATIAKSHDWNIAGTLLWAARLIGGMAALAGIFSALMRAVQILVSGSGPVWAVARTALTEAVRLKVSIVLIVLLVFMLAAIPDLLSDTTPLRHRVQTFLTYGISGPFIIIGMLTVLFSVSTVAFEQRDRQIWQTMTKPVAAWQYVLGKWLAVICLSGVLLGASSAGVFLFVEYLRSQPAQGESVKTQSAGDVAISDDRLALERQILVARVTVEPDMGRMSLNDHAKSEDSVEFLEVLNNYIAKGQLSDEDFGKDPIIYNKIKSDLFKEFTRLYRGIAPGQRQGFVFSGMKAADRDDTQIFLRYKPEAGNNDPSDIYDISFSPNDMPYITRKSGLGVMQMIPLAPFIVDEFSKSVISFDNPWFGRLVAEGLRPGQHIVRASDLINEKGEMLLEVYNGLMAYNQAGDPITRPNRQTLGFHSEGIEVSYSVGSWRGNFLRAVLVLWLKLAFLSMIAITAATFLSFPVACLIAIGAFLAAESTSFLTYSLEYYDGVTEKGKVDYFRVLVRSIAQAVAGIFNAYSDLSPTQKLAEGRLLAWSTVVRSGAIVAAMCVILYGCAVLIFKRRELATYSGQ